MALLLKYRITLLATVLVSALMLCFMPGVYGRLDFDEARVLQTANRKFNAAGVQNVQNWLALQAHLGGVDDQQLLKTINNFWNVNVFAGEDIHIWGRKDYWATPLETLGRRAGDCEDYVIGKYFSLIHAGVSSHKLRLIYVRAQVGGRSIAHMVLGYYSSPNAEPLLLDNLTNVIRPASQRPDLTPVFSFNSQGVYVAGKAQSSVESIGNWRGLLEKMRTEGFRP